MFKVLLYSVMVLAAQGEKSHVHGEAHLSLVFEGKNGKIQMTVPGSSIYGFEHAAKSAKDKKSKDLGLKKLEERISEMIILDPTLKCEVRKDISEIDQRETHSDIEIEFRVNCEKSPVGTNVILNVSKVFTPIKLVHVDVQAEGVQKSLEVHKSGEVIELK